MGYLQGNDYTEGVFYKGLKNGEKQKEDMDSYFGGQGSRLLFVKASL